MFSGAEGPDGFGSDSRHGVVEIVEEVLITEFRGFDLGIIDGIRNLR